MLARRRFPSCAAWVVIGGLWLSTTTTRLGAQEPRKPSTIELLPPTGPMPLGRTSFHWTDSRREQSTSEVATKREIMAQIWYPATSQAANTTAPYIPGFATLRVAIGEDRLKEAAGGSYAALSTARTHVVADTPVSSQLAKYPVLLLTHGLRFHSP